MIETSTGGLNWLVNHQAGKLTVRGIKSSRCSLTGSPPYRKTANVKHGRFSWGSWRYPSQYLHSYMWIYPFFPFLIAGAYCFLIDGSSRSCFLPPRPSNFSLLANVTGQLPTCHQLGIRVKGGVQPYTVTVASLDASIVTNVTMGENDDTYSYINRAQPGSQLLGQLCSFHGSAESL